MTAEAVLSREARTKLRKPIEAMIREAVLFRLGEPDDLHTVIVRAVSDVQYRVNVFVKADSTFRVAHSYFVHTDGQGNVLRSHPAILRAY